MTDGNKEERNCQSMWLENVRSIKWKQIQIILNSRLLQHFIRHKEIYFNIAMQFMRNIAILLSFQNELLVKGVIQYLISFDIKIQLKRPSSLNTERDLWKVSYGIWEINIKFHDLWYQAFVLSKIVHCDKNITLSIY